MPRNRVLAAALAAVSLAFGSCLAAPAQQNSNSTTKNQPQPAASAPAAADKASAAVPQAKQLQAHVGRDICKTHHNLPQCS